MDIRDQLLQEHSKANTSLIVKYIGADAQKLDELMNCFFSEMYRVSQRAAMAVSHCFDAHPVLMEPYKLQMIDLLEEQTLKIALKRNIVRILQFMDVPESHEAQLFDRCLTYISDTKEAIAVKAFSMTVLLNICRKHPDLKIEVIPLIEESLKFSDSAGVQNRGRKILKNISEL